MEILNLRRAVKNDIDWIVSLEKRPDFAAFIPRWPPEEHERNLSDRDKRYLMATDELDHPLAYVILAGLSSPAASIELVRLAVTRPGTGIGKPLLQRVIDLAFNELKANRLWLDVFDDNHRAGHVYQSVGFTVEGVLREAALKSDGQLGSLVIMSILKREYQLTANRPGNQIL